MKIANSSLQSRIIQGGKISQIIGNTITPNISIALGQINGNHGEHKIVEVKEFII